MFRNIIKPALILTAVGFISALILSHVDKITAPGILLQKAEKEKLALSIVLPGYTAGEEQQISADNFTLRYWVGIKPVEQTDGSRSVIKKVPEKAWAFICAFPGYSGDVEVMTGIKADGTITGMYIIAQTETPGLGARCMEQASTDTLWDLPAILSRETEEETKPWFQEQFTGLDSFRKINIQKQGDWTPDKREALAATNSITAITGATITSRAVINAVRKGADVIQKALEAGQDAGNGGLK